MPRNLVQVNVLIKTSAFCLNQTLNVCLCPTQCIDCSLMRVLMSLGKTILQLLLGMRSSNKIMPKWGISMPRCSLMIICTPVFISKLKFSYDKYSGGKVWTRIYCHFYFREITLKLQIEEYVRCYKKGLFSLRHK